MSRTEAEAFLNRWITRYVVPDDTASKRSQGEGASARSACGCYGDPGKPGAYRAVAFLRPHFQLEELTVSLRLVADLPAAVK